MSDSTACSICLDSFDRPKGLPCFHTFCQECLQMYVNKYEEKIIKKAIEDRCFHCPICRAKTKPCDPEKPVTEWAALFPTNNYILSFEDKRCSSHENEILNIHCKSCKVMICCECCFSAHKICEKTLTKMDAKRIQTNTRDGLQGLKVKSEHLEERLDKLEEVKEFTTMQVKLLSEELAAFISKQEKQWLGEIEAAHQKESGALQKRKDNIDELMKNIKENIDDLDSFIGDDAESLATFDYKPKRSLVELDADFEPSKTEKVNFAINEAFVKIKDEILKENMMEKEIIEAAMLPEVDAACDDFEKNSPISLPLEDEETEDVASITEPAITYTLEPEVANTLEPEVANTLESEVINILGPEVANTLEPEVANTLEPEVANTLEPEVANTLEPEVANTLEPEVANTLEPEVANTLESEVVNTLEPEVANTLEPEVANTLESEVVNTLEPEVANTLEPEVSNTPETGPIPQPLSFVMDTTFGKYQLYGINDMVILPDQCFLINLAYKKTLFKFSSTGEYVTEHKYSDSEPFGLCLLQYNCVAVSQPQSKKVSVLDCDYLTENDSFSFEKSYRGLASDDGKKLFCLYRDTYMYVDIISKNNPQSTYQIIHFVKLPASVYTCDNYRLRVLPSSGNVIIINSTNSLNVICFDQSGEVVFKYKGDSDEKLSSISDVAVSGNFVYVADKTANKIHRIQHDGSFVDVPLTANDGISQPTKLFVNNEGTLTVLTSNKQGVKIKCFT